MAAASPLPSTSRPIAKGKLKRAAVSDFIDPLYYNQLLDELRKHQDAGSAYYGSFVYEQQSVPASQLLPSGTPLFQSKNQTPLSQLGAKNAVVFERVASATVDKDSSALKLLTEPPESVRSRVLAQYSSAGKTPQRTGSGFKSPPVTGSPSDLKPAVEAVKFIEKAKAHYGGEGNLRSNL